MDKSSSIGKLTDTVFGFALAVGALSLTGTYPQNAVEVSERLTMFGLSFVILIVIWLRHNDLVDKLPVDKPKVVFLNIVLLFFVAVEPYLLNILNSSLDLFPFTSTLYAVDMTALMGISGLLAHVLVVENEGTLSTTQLKTYKSQRDAQLVFASLFLLSALPQFFTWTLMGTPVRVWLWYLTLAFAIGAHVPKRGKKKD